MHSVIKGAPSAEAYWLYTLEENTLSINSRWKGSNVSEVVKIALGLNISLILFNFIKFATSYIADTKPLINSGLSLFKSSTYKCKFLSFKWNVEYNVWL